MTIRPCKSLKFAVAALAIAMTGAAIPGAVTPAEAKKIIIVKKSVHHFHGHRHFRVFRPGLVVAGAGYGVANGCHWLKARAIYTGRPYWWVRYRNCIGE
jgi:hypothetical protein